jgi:hypothetical protein
MQHHMLLLTAVTASTAGSDTFQVIKVVSARADVPRCSAYACRGILRFS